MEYAAIIVLATIATYFIAYPLFAKKRVDFEELFLVGDTRKLDYLNSKKALILDNLKELEFEYEMGKLSDDDYASLRHGYLEEAQEVVRSIDELRVREEVERLIEDDVKSRRRIKDS